jgi:high-affinity K+ transport system ATPase subunit B
MKQSSTNHPISKNVTISLMLIGTIFFSNISHAAVEMRTTSTSVTSVRPMEKEKESAYLVRLNEINTMDKSKLSHADKKALRKEVRTIKSELAANNGGVFLSVGAIIIIILLLILLL